MKYASLDHPVTLADWNAGREKLHRQMQDKVIHPERYSNGILCPDCGHDLYDTGQQLKGFPVKLVVKCQNCKFKGERYE